MIDESKFTMPVKAEIVCKSCGGTLRPVYEFVSAYKEEFTKAIGAPPKNGGKWNCCICGMVYDSDFVNTGVILDWAEALKKHYELK